MAAQIVRQLLTGGARAVSQKLFEALEKHLDDAQQLYELALVPNGQVSAASVVKVAERFGWRTLAAALEASDVAASQYVRFELSPSTRRKKKKKTYIAQTSYLLLCRMAKLAKAVHASEKADDESRKIVLTLVQKALASPGGAPPAALGFSTKFVDLLLALNYLALLRKYLAYLSSLSHWGGTTAEAVGAAMAKAAGVVTWEEVQPVLLIFIKHRVPRTRSPPCRRPLCALADHLIRGVHLLSQLEHKQPPALFLQLTAAVARDVAATLPDAISAWARQSYSYSPRPKSTDEQAPSPESAISVRL